TNHGLNQYSRESGKFRRFYKSDGLPDNTVLGIVTDHSGHLWISTTKGLSELDTENMTFKTYNEHDGLNSISFNRGAFFCSSEFEVFFGSTGGAYCFLSR
ncbi:MAG: hypothetical protein HC906_13090, partial [Bacteroidales bacterium]|nr:hypothetical protein [Bacteroidales bacterium]